MAKLLETLIALLLAAALANTARSQSPLTYFRYLFYAEQPTTVTYQQDARHALSAVQLTSIGPNGEAVPNSVGRVLHTAPVLFKDANGARASFETSFNFMISPNAGDSTPAEGLAFFMAPVGSTPPEGSSGGNLGIFGANGNAPNVFAVEVDIFRNDWDRMSDHHIGVDLGSRVSSYTTPVPEGLVGKMAFVRINYDADTNIITISYTTAGSETKSFFMSYDLGTLLTDRVQVGLSASTGSFAARHQIPSWTFYSNIQPPAPTTSFSYNFFTERPTTLTFQHDAHYASDTKFLVLTNPVNFNLGRVLYTPPVLFKDANGAQASFQTTFDFIIRPRDGDTPADGLAFFIAPVGSTPPAVSYGGNLGIFGSIGTAPNVFAMEFDIFSNDASDPSYHHIGFDFGSRVSSTHLEVTDGLVGKLVFATVSYDAATKVISVTYNAGSATATTAMYYDLGNLLTDQVQVGLSASTGNLFSARHEILSWSFNSTIAPVAAAADIPQLV